MLKAEIEVGKDYGFRARSTDRGQVLLRITIEGSAAKGQWIALWHDGPKKGKRSSVPSGNLVTDWARADALVKEERQFLALMRSSNATWSPAEDESLLDAVNAVLSCTGELGTDPINTQGWLRGHLAASGRPFERVCARVGIPPDPAKMDPHGFVDRRGDIHIGFEAALQLAKRFAAVEPEIVLACLGERTRADLADSDTLGWAVRSNAATAIARAWTAGRPASEGAGKDLVRLEDLDDEWIRPIREFQFLALRHGAERRRLRAMLDRCAKELRRNGDRGLLIEVDLLLGSPILPDLNL